jgi:hypothetical protein
MGESAEKLRRAEALVWEVCATLDTSKEECCVTCGITKSKNWVEAKLFKKLVACAGKLKDVACKLETKT